MTSSIHAPHVQKGAIIALDPANPLASVIVFQYNPDKLTRSLAARTNSEDAGRYEPLRLQGPPQETISANVDIDAADQLEQGGSVAAGLGIHPQLAALEMLLYPKSAAVMANEALKAAGAIEVIPPKVPLTLFVWSAKRILPVRVNSLKITEDQFDARLNPTLATVELEMTVMSYYDLGLASTGGALYMGHQIAKEVMADLSSARNAAGTLSESANLPINV